MQSCVATIAASKQRRDVDPDWAKVRRGWCLGSETFRESLLMRLDDLRAGVKPSSHAGDEIREHNEHQAQRLLQRGLKVLGLTPAQLTELPKGAIEKQVLAWFIRRQTMVSNAWLSTALACGHPSNIPGYIKTVNGSRTKTVKQLVRAILKSED